MGRGEWYLDPDVLYLPQALVPERSIPPSPQAQPALHAAKVRCFVRVDKKVDFWQRPAKNFLGQVGVDLSIERTGDIPYFQAVEHSDPQSAL